jgi:hypothetical protein
MHFGVLIMLVQLGVLIILVQLGAISDFTNSVIFYFDLLIFHLLFIY